MKLLQTLVLSIAVLGLSACAGYSPINKNFDDATTSEIHVENVEVVNAPRKVGARQNAQYLKQILTRRFTGGANAPLRLNMNLTQSERNISFRLDATAERALLTIDSTAFVRDELNKVLATIETRTDAAYEIQTSPFATQANREQASRSALENLARDLQRQLNLFLSDYNKQNAAK